MDHADGIVQAPEGGAQTSLPTLPRSRRASLVAGPDPSVVQI